MRMKLRFLVPWCGTLFYASTCLGAPNTQDILDAIVGRQIFTDQQLATMDLNGDQLIDVADLVVLVTQPLKASFSTASSVIVEGDPTAGVEVRFTRSYTGTLLYRIRQLPNGQATNHQVAINGSTALIPLAAPDDEIVEDAQPFEIALMESSGYLLGQQIFHTLIVEDNDALWQGSYQNGGLSVPFRLKLVRNGNDVSAALVSDGYGIIPLNGENTDWPATTIDLKADRFMAEVNGILIPAAASQINVPLVRRYRFEANSGQAGQVVDATGFISGQVKEWISSPTNPYLNRDIPPGSFTLQKRITNVMVPDPVLVPSK